MDAEELSTEELQALAGLRAVCGPHAAEAELLAQLRTFNGNVARATNVYLRTVCVAPSAPPFDFEFSRPMQQRLPVSGPAQPPWSEDWSQTELWLPATAAFLELRELATALATSERVKGLLRRDGGLWLRAFRRLFGEELTKSSANGEFEALHRRARAERDRVCPVCATRRSVVPVVHGFPSPPLVVHHRTKRLLLTENCGFLGPPWICTSCAVTWTQYPFASTSTPLSRRPSRSSNSGGPMAFSMNIPPSVPEAG